MKAAYRWARSAMSPCTGQISYGYYNSLLQRRRNDLVFDMAIQVKRKCLLFFKHYMIYFE